MYTEFSVEGGRGRLFFYTQFLLSDAEHSCLPASLYLVRTKENLDVVQIKLLNY